MRNCIKKKENSPKISTNSPNSAPNRKKKKKNKETYQTNLPFFSIFLFPKSQCNAINNGVRQDENGNEPRIGQTKPDREKKEIGAGREGKAATFGAQAGVRESGSRGG